MRTTNHAKSYAAQRREARAYRLKEAAAAIITVVATVACVYGAVVYLSRDHADDNAGYYKTMQCEAEATLVHGYPGLRDAGWSLKTTLTSSRSLHHAARIADAAEWIYENPAITADEAEAIYFRECVK